MSISNPVRYADVVGGVVIAAIVALACGLYQLFGVDSHSTNGWILTALGFFSLVSAVVPQAPAADFPAVLLGWYAFAIIGCAALGLAIAEGSSRRVFIEAIWWILFGWYALNRASRLRRFVKARAGIPPHAGDELR